MILHRDNPSNHIPPLRSFRAKYFKSITLKTKLPSVIKSLIHYEKYI